VPRGTLHGNHPSHLAIATFNLCPHSLPPMCPWRSFSSPPSPSPSPSCPLSIPPSFLPNLSPYLLNSTPNLTPSFAIAKRQKPQNIVSLREPSPLFKPINYFPLGHAFTPKFPIFLSLYCLIRPLRYR